MTRSTPSFTIGIEEEYLLVDRATRQVAIDPPAAMMKECQSRLQDLIKTEFMKSQVEVATRVCKTVREARADLARLRRNVAEVAEHHGLAPIAASTHPFSEWQEQQHTDKERYNILARDLQAVVRRLLICGMHVHVGVEDDDLRIDLMNQVTYFLPHIPALTTSSPFWRGEDTGLKSDRLSVFNELPRTGLPERFDSFAEYRRHVDALVRAGIIEDATMLWWDVRPSARFPTLEMRVTDVCTRLDDAAAVAALFACIVHMLYRLRGDNQRWRIYSSMLIRENRWRAQRYGIDEGMVDFGKGEIVPFADLIEEIIALVREDAEALDCSDEIEHLRRIIAEGTSAHRQVKVYDTAVKAGASHAESLSAVVDMLIEETVPEA